MTQTINSVSASSGACGASGVLRASEHLPAAALSPNIDASAERSAATGNLSSLRARFPIFSERPDSIFFDNASTTQKPFEVIRCISDFYTTACSNAGRASYSLSSQTARLIEQSRQAVADLLDCSACDLVFTSGATESLNTVALAWGLANLKDGDEIMLCYQDHKSAVLPWLNVRRILGSFGREINIIPFAIHDVGDYDLRTIRERVSLRTRLLAMSHIHHLYGMDMEVKEIREIVGEDVCISLDASQSVGHIPVRASELPVDFISFSGHKMFAGNGAGGLYVKPERQGELRPVKVGGTGVSHSHASANPDLNTAFDYDATLQGILEAGTPNIPSILSMRPAADLIGEVGIDSIAGRVAELTRYLYERLRNLPGLQFGPGPGRCDCPGGYGIIAFHIEGVAASDLAFMLDSENIFVRTGDHCVSQRQEEDDLLRVSMHFYNNRSEIDTFVEVLEDCLTQ